MGIRSDEYFEMFSFSLNSSIVLFVIVVAKIPLFPLIKHGLECVGKDDFKAWCYKSV